MNSRVSLERIRLANVVNQLVEYGGTKMEMWYCVAAVVTGTLIPVQAGVNAQLRFWLASPIYATLVSLLTSTAAVSVAALVCRAPLPNFANAGQAPWWIWTGGLCGVSYVFAMLTLARHLGASALIASIICGQLFCSLVLDQFGLIGFAPHPATPLRMLGIVMLISGMVLIQKN